MPKLDQKTVNDGCRAAYDRYAAMTFNQACLTFSFEVHGWARWMINDHGGDPDLVRDKINALLDLLAKANAK